jgi:hypothetical protein
MISSVEKPAEKPANGGGFYTPHPAASTHFGDITSSKNK